MSCYFQEFIFVLLALLGMYSMNFYRLLEIKIHRLLGNVIVSRKKKRQVKKPKLKRKKRDRIMLLAL